MVKGKRLTQREGGDTFSIYLRSTLVERLAKYEDIGTVDECREAVKKQKPKKPVFGGLYACPNCKGIMLQGAFEARGNYCKHCGQALDWRGVRNEKQYRNG